MASFGEQPASSTSHCYRLSANLQAQLERKRYPGRWGNVLPIAKENARLMGDGGFTLPSGVSVSLPAVPPAETVKYVSEPCVSCERRFSDTEICVANVDTLTAVLTLGDACALNFANADIPGGRYRHGARAQEEDLCRLLPQLYPTLEAAEYPIVPGSALVSKGLLSVRRPGTYELCDCLGNCTVVSAAAPCGMADRRPPGGWMGSPWAETFTIRVRSVLHAARLTGHPNLVLGAFGCGAFGNPAGPVAAIFREQLESMEWRGYFSRVVFAVLDPLDTGNLGPFRRELSSISVDRVLFLPASGMTGTQAPIELVPAGDGSVTVRASSSVGDTALA